MNSLKIDEKTLSVYGSIDEGLDDPTVYDHVVMAADLGAVQSIFNNTVKAYKKSPAIQKVLGNIISNSLGKMKIAPDYKV